MENQHRGKRTGGIQASNKIDPRSQKWNGINHRIQMSCCYNGNLPEARGVSMLWVGGVSRKELNFWIFRNREELCPLYYSTIHNKHYEHHTLVLSRIAS